MRRLTLPPAALVLAAAIALAVPPTADAAPPSGPLEAARQLVRAGDDTAAIAALERVLPQSKVGSADERAARYLLGRLLTARGDARGLAHLQALPAPFESFEDLRLLWLGRAQVLAGRHADYTEGGPAPLAPSGEAGPGPHSPGARGQPLAPAAAGAPLPGSTLGRYADALASFDRYLKLAPKADEAPEIRLTRARLLHTLGRPADALAAITPLASEGPRWARAEALRQRADWLRPTDPARADEIERRLLVAFPAEKATTFPPLHVSEAGLTEDERFTRAEHMMKRWDYERARVLFRTFTGHPRYGEEARYHIGVIGLEKLRDAAEEPRRMFEPLAARPGRFREGALYRLMRTYIKEDRYQEALKVADRYDALYPKGERREDVAYYRAWLPFDEHRCEAAMAPMDAYIRSFGERRSLMRGFKAWCFIRGKDWKRAIEAYEELVPYGNPLVRGKAWYWQAYALDQLGRRPEAREKLARLNAAYPLSWYSTLGLQMQAAWDGKDPRASQLPWPEGGGKGPPKMATGPGTVAWPKLTGSNAERFARVMRLVELGEVDRAREAYKPIRTAVESAVPKAGRQAFLLAMGHAVEDYNRGWVSVSNGQLAAMSDMPDPKDARWFLGYPEAYRPLIERLGARFGVYPRFVYAIMRQESRYNPAAISHTDAVGALQMIPPTAELVARELGTTYDERTFWRPQVGFPFSFQYFKKHLELWRGNLTLTAASYNAGPAPVARWLKENQGKPLAFLVEEISYSEARNYARKVAEHLLRYLYLYEGDPKARRQVLDALFPVTLDVPVPADPGY